MITVELDPRHALPPVKGVEYGNADYEVQPEYRTLAGDLVPLGVLEGDPGSGNGTGLRPPEGVVVISQSTRMSDSGQMVIDVVLDIMDMPGATEYEVRMAIG